MTSDRPLPANVETEADVLAASLWVTDDATMATLRDLPADVFTLPIHRATWAVISGLVADRLLDPVAFSDRCRQQIEDGATVALGLIGANPNASPALLASWLAALRRMAHQRAVIHAAGAAMQAAWAPNADPVQIETDLASARHRHNREYLTSESASIRDSVTRFKSFAREVNERRAGGRVMRFGLPSLDTRCLWIPSYGLWMARTSHGKTALAASCAMYQANGGLHPVYFSLEQPAYQLAGRIASMLAGQSLHEVIYGVDVDPAANALRTVADLGITVIDGRQTIDSIGATCLRLKADGLCDVVYVDQMSRIDHRQGPRETKEQAWTRTSNRLAELWKALDRPVVLLTQLNAKDAREHPDPSPSHVKDCGSLLEDSCWQLLIDRPDADPDRAKKLAARRKKAQVDGHDEPCTVGKLVLTLTKDRNSTMGGGWSELLGFCARSGLVYDPNSRTGAGLARLSGAEPEEQI